jgi:hypothetical protein
VTGEGLSITTAHGQPTRHSRARTYGAQTPREDALVARRQAPVGAPKESPADADYRARLTALRDRLEAAIAEAGHRDLAPLAARYAEVIDKLAGLPEIKEGDVLDEFTARRARSAGAARPQRPAASGGA